MVSQGVSLKELVFKLVVDQFCGCVVIAFDFIADDVLLVFDLRSGIGAVEDDVCQQVDGTWQVFLEDGSIEDGVFLVRKGVQVAAYALQTVENLQGSAPVGAFEGDVFTEVGQSLFACFLLSGTGSDADAAIDHGGYGGQVDDAQAV